MARAGRKPQGCRLIDELHGNARSAGRLKAFLRTMMGECTVAEACRELGLRPSQFFSVRRAWLLGSLKLIEPQATGRPPHESAENGPEVLALKREVRGLRRQLMAAELRRAVAQAGTRDSRPRVRALKKKHRDKSGR